jgi:hypothetical protein
LRWEIVRRNAPHIWRDFGSALPFQTRLTQTKQVQPLSNEHGSQVKDQGRRQYYLNKHKKIPIGLHVMYLYFPDTSHPYIKCAVQRLVVISDGMRRHTSNFLGFITSK